MKFSIDKESLLSKIRIVERITSTRGIQPVLANILIEANTDNNIKLSATDLDISVISKTTGAVEVEGKITLPAKKLIEIVSKMPDKPIKFSLNSENNVTTISCANSKFELIGINADEFPSVIKEEEILAKDIIEIETAPLLKCIKNTAYAAAGYENRNIISGVFFLIEKQNLEMAATDGNRLVRIIETINNKDDKTIKAVIPSRTMQEILRITSIVFENKMQLIIDGTKIIFKTNSFILSSRLLEGEYPPYKQLIPQTFAKEAIVKKDETINALERVSTMVNERTSIIKFIFKENTLTLMADTPDTGQSEEILEIDYNHEELIIAFNYKYVLESLKIMDSEKAIIGLGGSLSATILKPDSQDKILSLIMPIQIRDK